MSRIERGFRNREIIWFGLTTCWRARTFAVDAVSKFQMLSQWFSSDDPPDQTSFHRRGRVPCVSVD